jgi:hypothetical protein
MPIRMNSDAMERTIQIKTYKMKSPSEAPSALELCTSKQPLPEDVFPTPQWQHLRMGSLYACWRLVRLLRDDFTGAVSRRDQATSG